MTAPLSRLPPIDRLLAHAAPLVETYGHAAVVSALRAAVEEARLALRDGATDVPEEPAMLASAAETLAASRPGPPVAVLNAAGVVVHTNLGRAPLSGAARRAVADAAGYCDLEYDLNTGRRGSRGARLDPLLAEATGAEAGMAVNNAAAALVLVLGVLAAGREVPVSRGELVEIGGSFRLPEIMAASGARLLEVGTTNRTRAADYEQGKDVGMLLKVHPSNYEIRGFTQAPTVSELAEVARRRRVPLVHDVGSGVLVEHGDDWLAQEPVVTSSLAAGADLVLCSGDKLLGGPQAGLLVGRADLIARCRRAPLARALRLDKLRVAALVATLEIHLRGQLGELPVWSALRTDRETLTARCQALADRLGGAVVEGRTLIGGGSAPGAGIEGPVVRLETQAAKDVARRLRTGRPAVIVRIDAGALWFDLRTVPADRDRELAACVGRALELE